MDERLCILNLDPDAKGASLCGRPVGRITQHFDASAKSPRAVLKVEPVEPVLAGLDGWWVNRDLYADRVCGDCLRALRDASTVVGAPSAPPA